MGLSGTISDYLTLSDTIWDYLTLSDTIWDYLELSRTISDYLNYQGASKNRREQVIAIWNFFLIFLPKQFLEELTLLKMDFEFFLIDWLN